MHLHAGVGRAGGAGRAARRVLPRLHHPLHLLRRPARRLLPRAALAGQVAAIRVRGRSDKGQGLQREGSGVAVRRVRGRIEKSQGLQREGSGVAAIRVRGCSEKGQGLQ